MDWLVEIPVLLFFAANACYAFAYSLRNMLGLRVLSVLAAFMTLPYFVFQSEVLFSAIIWQMIFALVNFVNIVRLLYERRPVKLTQEQQHLKNLVFRNYTSREMLKLLEVATWHSASKGQILIRPDSSIECLYLLYSGIVDVTQNGKFLTRRRPGAFLGEVHFMTGELTTAQVVFGDQGSYLRWDNDQLRMLFEKNPSLAKAFESMLAMDMARKLKPEEALA